MIKRRLILILLLVVMAQSFLYAQENYLGIRGGINGGNITSQPYIPKKMNFGHYEAGLVFKRISDEKWLGGIQIEGSYVQTAFTLMPRPKSDSSYNRSLSYVEVPFMWHPYYGFGKKENVRVFLNAGAYVSYMLDSKYEYIDNKDKTSDYNRSGNYQFNKFLDVRLGYGLIGGGGVEVMLTSHLQLQLEFRYRFAFSDVWKNKAKVDPALTPPNERELEQMFGKGDYSQSQVSQMGGSFSLMYRFGGKKEKKIIDKE